MKRENINVYVSLFYTQNNNINIRVQKHINVYSEKNRIVQKPTLGYGKYGN